MRLSMSQTLPYKSLDRKRPYFVYHSGIVGFVETDLRHERIRSIVVRSTPTKREG